MYECVRLQLVGCIDKQCRRVPHFFPFMKRMITLYIFSFKYLAAMRNKQ